MDRSRYPDRLLPDDSAPQHERAPRPLPLFLELVREVSLRDPKTAADALAGLRAYQGAPPVLRSPPRPEVARVEGACLRDHGGSGAPAVLVPSLINPPRILDLDADVSLTDAIARMGRRTLLLDWGKADDRATLSISDHIEELLRPLLAGIGEPVALIGYCLGGTMSIAVANMMPVEMLITIAAPWDFGAYPDASRNALQGMWRYSEEAAREFGALPMEVLQAAFWSLDPERTVRKFAHFAGLYPKSNEARRFIELEEWANEGEPLPYPAARELMEDMFGANLPGRGAWEVGGRRVADKVAAPALHLLADHDRIAPGATAPRGERVPIPSGHVGMIVGKARRTLQHAINDFLTPCR